MCKLKICLFMPVSFITVGSNGCIINNHLTTLSTKQSCYRSIELIHLN